MPLSTLIFSLFANLARSLQKPAGDAYHRFLVQELKPEIDRP
jgi:hypothetical protein